MISETNNIKRIHFIGIGGIGMSGLARFFLNDGKVISGSDRAPSAITDALEKEGVSIFPSQVAANITTDIDMVVYTEAMSSDQEEMVAARALGVPMMNYFEALGAVANEYYLIAVSGAHGKTTTTAMLADILEAADFDPTVIVGSLRAKTGSNFRPGKSKYALVEACEYKRDFLSLRPDVLIITNLEHEHVDFYKDLASVQQAFRDFAMQVRPDGVVIANISDPNLEPVLNNLAVEVIDYRSALDLEMPMRQPGLHNRQNAAAALAAAAYLVISKETAKTAIANFSGTWRRFEYKGILNGAPVYDDYAHHPTEIKATIAAARELYPDKKVLAIFQAHTYSRTAELFEDFRSALTNADEVILAPIYAAREENISGISHAALANSLKEGGNQALALGSLEEITQSIKEKANDNQVILIMGAGDISQVAISLFTQ